MTKHHELKLHQNDTIETDEAVFLVAASVTAFDLTMQKFWKLAKKMLIPSTAIYTSALKRSDKMKVSTSCTACTQCTNRYF